MSTRGKCICFRKLTSTRDKARMLAYAPRAKHPSYIKVDLGSTSQASWQSSQQSTQINQSTRPIRLAHPVATWQSRRLATAMTPDLRQRHAVLHHVRHGGGNRLVSKRLLLHELPLAPRRALGTNNERRSYEYLVLHVHPGTTPCVRPLALHYRSATKASGRPLFCCRAPSTTKARAAAEHASHDVG